MIGRLQNPSTSSETTRDARDAADADSDAATELRQTAYTWDVATDSLTWCNEAAGALALGPTSVPATG
ncbi:MAG: hypothetical protein AAFO62_11120, partial [Pseudomonadota bacterium]